MTRHNLAVNISWLLSNKVNIHGAVPSNNLTHPVAAAEVLFIDSEEESSDDRAPSVPSSPLPNRQAVRKLNAGQDFVRPALPPTTTPRPPQLESVIPLANESMGKLSSASKSTRAGLVSQHQLATPASTTGSTGTFTQGYTAQLRASKSQLLLT
jgi:bloom syndrome protein